MRVKWRRVVRVGKGIGGKVRSKGKENVGKGEERDFKG